VKVTALFRPSPQIFFFIPEVNWASKPKHAIIAQLKAPFPCGVFGVTYASEILGFFNVAPRIQFSQAFPFGQALIRMFYVNVEGWEYF
jgi:hypothetical protein